jgi:hypothetical protein
MNETKKETKKQRKERKKRKKERKKKERGKKNNSCHGRKLRRTERIKKSSSSSDAVPFLELTGFGMLEILPPQRLPKNAAKSKPIKRRWNCFEQKQACD